MQLIPEKGMRFLVGILYRQYCGSVAEAAWLSVGLASGWSTDNFFSALLLLCSRSGSMTEHYSSYKYRYSGPHTSLHRDLVTIQFITYGLILKTGRSFVCLFVYIYHNRHMITVAPLTSQ